MDKDRKKEIDNILKESEEKYKNGECKTMSLDDFLERRNPDGLEEVQAFLDRLDADKLRGKIQNFYVRIYEWGELRAEICYWDGALETRQLYLDDYFSAKADLQDVFWFFRSRLEDDYKKMDLSANEVIEHLKMSKGTLMHDSFRMKFLKRKPKSFLLDNLG